MPDVLAAAREGFETRHWPLEIRLKRAEKLLEVDWDDGVTHSLPAELLRVESPSAEIQGHGQEEKTILPGRRHVGILGVDAVGHYAVRLRFDDLHDTGLYSWRYLRALGEQKDAVWQAYLDALKGKGLSRDP
ncbi:gamma-butyrobetaine hydroxylase-like domain-containing protein [Radicibacter daui]|uniref:gamma-butyrobetaine hydroxylase-like domain-containing protein n=1 Tax=Radicibacter daui TaxID=3064829 RepID=UPI004046E92A